MSADTSYDARTGLVVEHLEVTTPSDVAAVLHPAAVAAPTIAATTPSQLDRFARPVAWQSVPDSALPPALQEGNPWRVPRRVDGVRVGS